MKLTKKAMPPAVKGASTFVWTTSEGQRMKLHQIEDPHLFNICRMMHRRAEAFKALGEMSGVIGIPYKERACVRMSADVALQSINKTVSILEAELTRRDLLIPERQFMPLPSALALEAWELIQRLHQRSLEQSLNDFDVWIDDALD